MLHELPCEQRYLHGYFSPDLLEPVVEIDPGDSVRISVPNHAWDTARDEHLEPRSLEHEPGHALAGPILVRGARPAQTLVVRTAGPNTRSTGSSRTVSAVPFRSSSISRRSSA